MLHKLHDDPNSTSKKYAVEGHIGTISIISTMSESFCSSCNRLRITADGKIKNCLFGKSEYDILSQYREGKDILSVIKKSVFEKNEMYGGQFSYFQNISPGLLQNRSMIKIGG